jgi:hypothetical protein
MRVTLSRVRELAPIINRQAAGTRLLAVPGRGRTARAAVPARASVSRNLKCHFNSAKSLQFDQHLPDAARAGIKMRPSGLREHEENAYAFVEA